MTQTQDIPTQETSLQSLRVLAPRSGKRRVLVIIAALLAGTAAALVFVPWQQTVVAHGQVSVFGAMDRPQSIEALIPGRLTAWYVQEGQKVKKGDVLARIEDIDSKFLDTSQAKRLAEQNASLLEQKSRATARITRLNAQLASLSRSQELAISTAKERVAQTRQRRRSAAQSLVQAQKAFEIGRDVAQSTASERLSQLQDAVRQAEQSVLFAKQDVQTARIQRERIAELFRLDLRSKRDDELAENDLVSKQVRVKQAEDALKIARRSTTIGGLAQNQTGLELERAGSAVTAAQAAVEIAERDISASLFDLNRVLSDTTAQIASIEAGRESARESRAKIDADLAKLAIDRRNLSRRTDQQVVKAPRTGRVVRVFAIGTGDTVKSGDSLATILPDTLDQAVELSVSDNDAPLLAAGRQVRLQFAGFPALQVGGVPSAMVGTFAGRLRVIDAVDDGTARYRVVVEPDFALIKAGKAEAWPKSDVLRPGGEATGWILLDKVPLGWELWRQFNAFPATVKRAPVASKNDKGGAEKPSGKEGDRDGEKNSDFLKLKKK